MTLQPPPLAGGDEFLSRASSIEITDADRQAGYVPSLLDELKPRGGGHGQPARRTPPPPPPPLPTPAHLKSSGPPMGLQPSGKRVKPPPVDPFYAPEAVSLPMKALSETGASAGDRSSVGSLDVDTTLNLDLAGGDSQPGHAHSHSGHSAHSFKHLKHPAHYAQKANARDQLARGRCLSPSNSRSQRSRSRGGSQRPPAEVRGAGESRGLKWWQRPKWILVFVGVIVVVIVAVGAGAGVSLSHSSTTSSAAKGGTTPGAGRGTTTVNAPVPSASGHKRLKRARNRSRKVHEKRP